MDEQARRYVITGAASGIGKVAAEQAASDGIALCLTDVNEDALLEVATDLQSRGATVVAVAADLADPSAPAQIIQSAVSALGGLDSVIANAGFPVSSPLADLEIADFDKSYAINTRATWLLGKEALPHLEEARGSIVATNSICGHFPAPPLAAYGIAKAAGLLLVQHMALEWGPRGVRANSVSPGPTITGMTAGMFNDTEDPAQRAMRERRESFLPLRKLGTAQECANAILFLAGPGASQITGQDILVDGGLSIALMPAAGGGTGREHSTSETYREDEEAPAAD
jgi:NAD(P)-dependent dehydrogenase (short-subunit alcohol dehydrogenase family)